MNTVQLNGFKWTVKSSDAIGGTVAKGNNWEPHLMMFMAKFLKYGDVCIDVGACFGWHTLQMARIVGPQGHVYAFEPQQGNYKLLQQNIHDNGLKNVTTINLALGDKKMQSCICGAYEPGKENWGDGFVSPQMENADVSQEEFIRKGVSTPLKLNKEVINCERMDDQGIETKVRFIKIDVQGFERMVLQGGQELIKRDRPVMVIEVENPCLAQFGYSSKELFDTIRRMGYDIFLLDYEYPCDHVCVPSEQLQQFEEHFEGMIQSHTENNPLTDNVINGINRKIVVR